MNAVPFDTLKLAKRLEAAGLAPPVAAGASEALADAITEADLATREDVNAMGAGVRAEIATLRSELRAVIVGQQSELKATISAQQSALKGEMVSLRVELKSDLEILKRDMTIRLGGMMTFLIGIALAAARLMLVHS